MDDNCKKGGASERRKSIRLSEYDYSQAGLYFITICTHDRVCLFGEIVGAGSKPAHAGDAGLSRADLAPVRTGLEPAPTQGTDHVRMVINEYGHIVEDTWFDLVNHVFNIQLHEFIIMPNHIHGIIEIHSSRRTADSNPPNLNYVGAGSKPAHADDAGLSWAELAPMRTGLDPAPKGYSLAEIVRQLKTFSAKRINKTRNTPGITIWQRNYYEHIIRDEKSYLKIAEYIQTNPLKWQEDIYHI